jgi:hypothetical protein
MPNNLFLSNLRFLRKSFAIGGFAPIFALSAPMAISMELHVSPSGSDSHSGTVQAPLKTLGAARDAARRYAGKEAVTITVADGVYYLPETLVFHPEDSGSKTHPIRYKAANEGAAIISGGLKLELKWTPFRDGIFQANTPPGLAIDQLFIAGKRQRMARYPNYDAAKTTDAYQGYSADAFSNERAARWTDPKGGYIHAMHSGRWGGYHYRITGKNEDGSVAYEGGWQNNRQMGMHPEFRMVENIFEELDAPGEWFHNAKQNTLFFMPEPGTDPQTSSAEVVRLHHLIEFQGSEKSPIRFITLEGFVFRHAARTFMENKEPLLRSDWTIYRGGAVTLTGTENIGIHDCEFDQPGGNAVFFNHYNRNSDVRGCHIHDAGASGVCFVGDPAAVRNPLFEYGQTHDLTQIDRTPGPKTNNYPANCAVIDTLIHGIGRVERQPAGVQISMAQDITVKDCSIYDCARAGINIGDGCWGGHVIEGCDVFDTVLETHDHGSFNSWGRDRFWMSNHRGVSMPEVKKDPKLPFLDVVKTIIIRDSRWRCDHGWDVDLDDGSSNYEIYNNLMLRGGLKLREGYGRKAYNNVMVNCGLHPHVWFDESGDQFYQNIVMAAHADISMPPDWSKGVDRNFFSSEGALQDARSKGCDANSLSGDPLFVNPETGDFRVQKDSPAMKIGFRNFPMDRFGVKKPSLKAMAKTPEIPALQSGSPQAPIVTQPHYWLGSRLHGLKGEEFSAFGVTRDDGGVQLVDVPEGSPAASAGLKSNDLIQAVNGTKTPGTSEFFAALLAAGDRPLRLKVVRFQKASEINLTPDVHLLAESGSDEASFSKLKPVSGSPGIVTASQPTDNQPLGNLTDGQLTKDYGPVFANGARETSYMMDLGSVKSVTSISSWSFNQNGNRARQLVTIFGSPSDTNPGWDTKDRSKFIPLGTIDTASLPIETFHAASLRSCSGKNLGNFRWIVWTVDPATAQQEHSAYQELEVRAGL